MRQALILGAVNPVGCRVAEALCDRGQTVVALVDDWVQAARLVRLPVRMIEGHVADREALTRAMAGCDVAFHCAAYDRPFERASARGARGAVKSAWQRLVRGVDQAFSLRRRNLDCAEAILSAALQSGIRRVVCLNTAAVSVARGKAVLRAYQERGLSVTVLRPATLYGPFCSWTIDAIRALRRGRRLRGGAGPCLYVDHLVEAMLLAAATDAGAGEVFSLYDPEPASCAELVEAHARALNGDWEHASTTCAVTGKARADAEIQRVRGALGYNPTSAFAENMERTAAWIQWSRL